MAAFKTFKDISIFITGCNRGIGLTLVKQILSLPDSPKVIFATCRSLKSDSSRELRGLAEKNPILHLLEFDVTNALQLENVVKEVETNLAGSGLNLLINNAGIYDLKNSEYGVVSNTLDEVTRDLMMKVYETNAVAPLMIVKAFLPLLRRAAKGPPCQPQATVVNMSSEDGSIELNHGGHYQYKCSKAAVNMLTVSLSLDYAKDGITVVCIDPGWIKTDMGGKAAPLTLPEAIPSLVKLIGSLDLSKTGSFLQYNGNILPW
jgi:NAD(P)-dependent dehydrogenase (short-subunit alcohol dehydrogenase family)